MKKAKILQKKIIRQAIIMAVVMAVGIGLVVGSGSLLTEAETKKTTAENNRNQYQSQLTTMQTQIQQSGEAEKKFIEIAGTRETADYSLNSDGLKEWLRAAKDRYRLGDGFKLTLALEEPAQDPSLAALLYDVKLRKPIKLELDAMSDSHVFSFLQQMQRQIPGLLSVTHLTLTRAQDMSPAVISQMRMGQTPLLVHADLEFTWIGLQPKPSAETPGASPAAGGGV